MNIRPETAADETAISRIHYTAFMGHPQHAPGAEPTEHLIVERLRRAGDLLLSLVLERDGQILGHIAMSPARIGAEDKGWYVLGPVGVLPECQKQGLGSVLVREALERMRALGARGVVLVGDPKFYGRFGFAQPGGLTCMDVPREVILALCFGGNAPVGEITLHKAFFGE